MLSDAVKNEKNVLPAQNWLELRDFKPLLLTIW